MAEYTYIPFPKKYLTDAPLTAGVPESQIIWTNLSTWDDGAWDPTAKGHFMEKSIFGVGKRPLQKVARDDILNISAHGMGDYGKPISSTLIGAAVQNSKTGQKGTGALSVRALALRLQKDGLTTDFRDLRLMVCYSGLPGGSRFNYAEGQVDGPAACASECLASLLARELGLLGYRSIVVSGAVGEVVGKSVVVGFKNDGGLKGIHQKYASAFGSRRFKADGRRVSGAA